MAKLVYALNQSLDGYVDHTSFAPDPALFQHFIEDVATVAGSVYGRLMYETMRYWDDDQADWDEPRRAYAAAWRRQPKWVLSRSLTAVGPNATLVRDDVEATVRRLKERLDGVIEVAGPETAAALGDLGLIDEYRIYLHPAVVGGGKPFFAKAPPPLKLVASERFGERAIRLTYVPE